MPSWYLVDKPSETVVDGPYDDWDAAHAAREDGQVVSAGTTLELASAREYTDIELEWAIPPADRPKGVQLVACGGGSQ